MDRIRELRAYERWKGFQPDFSKIRGGEANRDGSIPRPQVALPTPEQKLRFEKREDLRERFESVAYRGLRAAMERKMGATLDFVDLPPSEQALKAGRPVVRIVKMAGAGMVPSGFATGFLIAPDLLLTNYHVFRTADEAQTSGAQFLYEKTKAGLREGLIFALEPNRFFLNNKALDYAVVAIKPASVDGAPLSQFQFLPLIAAKGKIVKGDAVNIIQHPNGEPKQYATVNNKLLDIRDDGFLLYETDTLEGSSGSPVFNEHWETIALHHCGVPRIEDGKLVTKNGQRLPLDAEVDDDDLEWVANEGVRVSALVASFAQQRMQGREQQAILDRLIALTCDPLLSVETMSPMIDGAGSASMPGGSEMAQNIFNFAGPVAIHIASAGSAVVVPQPAATVTVEVPAFPEKTLKFDENYKTRKGYQAGFLTGWNVTAPTLNAQGADGVLRDDAGEPMVIPYYHYSLVMNEARRLVTWTACNVNYSPAARRYTKSRKQYGGENWRLDPRVALHAPGMQIENVDFYGPATKIDRGHVVRREDSAWGTTIKEAEFGNSDTYHWTNCTPQSEAFNQSGLGGIWGHFEEHIQREVKAEGGKMSVFAGPVLNADDPEHGYEDGATIQVPMEYWKVVVGARRVSGATEKLAYGFVFDQTEAIDRLGYERMDMTEYEVYQVPIAEVTAKTGVVFDQSVLDADVMREGHGPESLHGGPARKKITSLAGIVLA